jgi:predicted house-cleaning noncanonical NTP pyrophosphatase (MazG superfamily)
MTAVRAPQLTRDNLLPRHDNEICRKVDPAVTCGLLVAKLHAEAEEIARDLTNPEEYGDLIETIYALARLNKVDLNEIDRMRSHKRAKKGGLQSGNLWVPSEFFNVVHNS